MFNPDLREVLEGSKSRYSLVTAVARRARQVSEDEILKEVCGTEKPVTFALEEFLDGELEIQEAQELREEKAERFNLMNKETEQEDELVTVE